MLPFPSKPTYSPLSQQRSATPQRPQNSHTFSNEPLKPSGTLQTWGQSSESPLSKFKLSSAENRLSDFRLNTVGMAASPQRATTASMVPGGIKASSSPLVQSGNSPVVQDLHEKMHYHIDMSVKLNAEKKELEILVNDERRKNEELRFRYESELENERRARAELERRVQTLVNELNACKHEIQENKMQFGEIEHVLSSNETENKSLREEVRRSSDVSSNRIRDLEEKLKQSMRETNQAKQQILSERNTLLRENEARFQSALRESEMRQNQIEEQLRIKSNECHDLESENNRNREYLRKLIIESEEKLRVVIAQVKDEETRKYTLPLREQEAKLQLLAEEKDYLSHSIQELLYEQQSKEKQANEKFAIQEEQLSQMRNEIGSLEVERENSLSLIARLRQELDVAQNEAARTNEEKNTLEAKLRDFEEMSLRDMDRAIAEFNITKEEWQSHNNDMRNRILELEHICQKSDAEIKRVTGEYRRLREVLHSNLNQTIEQVMVDHKEIGEVFSPTKGYSSINFRSSSKSFY